MENTQELQAKLNQISQILGGQVGLVQKIQNRVSAIKQEFNDSVDNNEFELIELAGLDNEELHYDNFISDEDLFCGFKERMGGQFDFYELEEFVDAVRDYKRERLKTKKRVIELEALLEE